MSVRFILDARVKPECEQDLRRAYAALRERVEQAPGLIEHQLCESIDSPARWLVISEWESLEASSAWNRSEDHARLIEPMRACFAQAEATQLHVRDGARPAAPGLGTNRSSAGMISNG